MMKTYFTVLLIAMAGWTNGQDIKIFTENIESSTIFYAANKEYCPVSVSLDLNLLNMGFSMAPQKIFVVPARTDRFKLGALSVTEPGKKYKYSYQTKTVMGNITQTLYDKDFLYDLPFAKGKAYKVGQGYNGSFSHSNEYALDFVMPEGTEILAAREGIVIKVVQLNAEGCAKEECKKYNNNISIYHSDGSFATYSHIKYNGARVKLGDTVKKGDLLALSGNTGWSSGPHLHFVCYQPDWDKWKSFSTKFRINDGAASAILLEKETYTRQY